MYISDLKFLAVVVGIITVAAFLYSKYLDWKIDKEDKLKKQG